MVKTGGAMAKKDDAKEIKKIGNIMNEAKRISYKGQMTAIDAYEHMYQATRLMEVAAHKAEAILKKPAAGQIKKKPASATKKVKNGTEGACGKLVSSLSQH